MGTLLEEFLEMFHCKLISKSTARRIIKTDDREAALNSNVVLV